MTSTHTATETKFEPLGYLQIVIMHVLWNLKPEQCTVRTVMADVNERRAAAGQQPLAYTTYLTVMRNLARRGFVRQTPGVGLRDGHTFVPRVTKEKYETDIVRFIRDTVFEGNIKRFAATVGTVTSGMIL